MMNATNSGFVPFRSETLDKLGAAKADYLNLGCMVPCLLL